MASALVRQSTRARGKEPGLRDGAGFDCLGGLSETGILPVPIRRVEFAGAGGGTNKVFCDRQDACPTFIRDRARRRVAAVLSKEQRKQGRARRRPGFRQENSI